MKGLSGFWVLCPVFLIASDFLIAKKAVAAPQHLTTTKYASQLAKKKLHAKKKALQPSATADEP